MTEQLGQKPNAKILREQSVGVFSQNDNQSGVLGEIEVTMDREPYIVRYSVIPRDHQKNDNLRARLDITRLQGDELPSRVVPYMHLVLAKNQIAALELTYIESREGIKIETRGASRKGFESKGYSSGLALLIDTFVRDVNRRYVEEFAGKRIICEIQDAARDHLSGLERKGWSSNVAKELNFQSVGVIDNKPTFIKIYQ